jgi:transposase InsO family protein
MADNGPVGARERSEFRRGRHRSIMTAPDMLQHDFTAAVPDRRWAADISEFACCDGNLYLVGIRDLCDCSLVGWSMGERRTTDPVVAALVMAVGRRSPTVDTIQHANRGTRCTLLKFTNRLHDGGLVGN